MAASKASPPNYPLATAAFKKAYGLDPRRKVRRREAPDPGLFEIPTRLAAAYRANGQPYEAQKMYEWVLIVARALASLGRVEEAIEAYEKAVEADEGRRDAAAVSALEKMRENLKRKGEEDRARQVGLALERLRAPKFRAADRGGVPRIEREVVPEHADRLVELYGADGRTRPIVTRNFEQAVADSAEIEQ